MSPVEVELAGKLSALIAGRTGAACEISGLTKLTGGAVNEAWRFDAVINGVNERFVLRRSTEPDPERLPKDHEARLQIAALAAGVPVAPIRWTLTPNDGIGDGYVMAFIDGETIPRKILRDVQYAATRENLVAQFGAIAGAIHAVPLESLPPLPRQTFADQLLHYQALYRNSGAALPVFELAFQWLERQPPPAGMLHLVHGDFRMGNFIVGTEGVRAILDWEMAHLGDPMEDLGWLCVNSWRYGITGKPVGGVGNRETLFRNYEKAAGQIPDPKVVSVWQAMGSLKWGMMCIGLAGAHAPNAPRSVERAAIGRRVSETELDLLQIMEHD